MKHDWRASAERLLATVRGGTPDRVPLTFLASEDIAARISGLTVREMLTSSKKLAEVSVQVCEVLGGDSASVVVTPYCGPYEGLAFAKANGRADVFEWKDYTTPFIHEGRICESEADIENLEMPDHRRVEPWPTILEASAIVREQTGMAPGFAPSLTWSSVQMLRGSRAYMDVIESPELLLRLCEKIYASQWDYYQAYCGVVGRPLVAFNCEYAFNRTMLRFEDAWRFEGQFVNRFCREAGLPLAIHNCGFDPYWVELVERHRAEGVEVVMVNGSHPQDLDRWVAFREKFPDIVISGASLFVNAELENGAPADVAERVRQNIEKLAPYGRFVVTPVCCMPWRVSLSNIFAVREAVERYGRYPIQVRGPD
jgi:uroporphyrinogen-III decarboxylase